MSIVRPAGRAAGRGCRAGPAARSSPSRVSLDGRHGSVLVTKCAPRIAASSRCRNGAHAEAWPQWWPLTVIGFSRCGSNRRPQWDRMWLSVRLNGGLGWDD